MTRRLDKVKTDKVRGPNSKLVTNGPEAQKIEINKVTRTKLDVYSCPSLRIAENQEQGKDKNGQSSRPKFKTRHKRARGPNMKISTVARTKLGVYRYVQLHKDDKGTRVIYLTKKPTLCIIHLVNPFELELKIMTYSLV